MSWNSANDLLKADNLLFYLVSGTTSAQTVEEAIVSGTCKVLAYATSVNIQIDSESIDTSSKFSCKWGSNFAGRANYTISADALYCQKASADANGAVTFDHLMDLQVAGTPVGWVIGQEVDRGDTDCESFAHTLDKNKPYYYGKAAITSLSLSGGNNEIASSSITLAGDGPIERK